MGRVCCRWCEADSLRCVCCTGVVWCGVVWCGGGGVGTGVVWCGVVWVWCGVGVVWVWCGVVVWVSVWWCGHGGCGVVWWCVCRCGVGTRRWRSCRRWSLPRWVRPAPIFTCTSVSLSATANRQTLSFLVSLCFLTARRRMIAGLSLRPIDSLTFCLFPFFSIYIFH